MPPRRLSADYSTRIAGEVRDLDCSGYVLKKLEKRIDKVIKYMTVAGKKVRCVCVCVCVCVCWGGLSGQHFLQRASKVGNVTSSTITVAGKKVRGRAVPAVLP